MSPLSQKDLHLTVFITSTIIKTCTPFPSN
nr:MAG TPA: hypothetical protein [Caudoviricetes sp.]